MPRESVDLIASGYEFVCPSCGHENVIGWIPVIANAKADVSCVECKGIFEINSYDHAYHRE